MVPNESPSLSVARRGSGRLGSDPLRTVVWVRGEHDIATRVQVSDTIDHAAHLDDDDIIVDLSGVTFMDASTVGALVAARNRLRSRSHSLTVRAPSPRARRLLDVCGLAQLIDDAAPTQPTALGSWVDVRTSDRDPDSAPPSVVQEAPSQEAAPATAPRGGALTGSIPHARAPS